MSPTARGWLDALLGTAVFLLLTGHTAPAPAATIHHSTQEITMTTNHSQGPFRAVLASPTGYTTIHDPDGRLIGAALTGNDQHARGLPRDTVEANGRLFAASHTLCAALTGYMNAVDKAQADGAGFTEEIVEALDEARQEAHQAFAILLGSAS